MEKTSMAFTIQDRILALVRNRAEFIEHLMDEYPRLLEEWSNKTDQQFQQEAKQNANGDPEIEWDELSQMRYAFDDNDSRKDMFYKAMLMLVYSYYDGLVDFLTEKRINANEKVDAFYKSKNIEQSQDSQQANKAMNDVRVLRNQIVHNNVDTPKHIGDVKRLCTEWDGLYYEDEEIRISSSKLIRDALNKAQIVLEELCKHTGHTHKHVGTYK